MLAAYQAMDPIETVWHLPDGRALRVSISQNPQGGVTYLFDDATQSFALASQVNAMTRVQGETLDALKEGVAVFGADGRLKFSNPAFLDLWRLDPERASARPHIDEITRQALPMLGEAEAWKHLCGAVVGLSEARNSLEQRLHRTDGRVLESAALPLPDGATLLTFFDTTATANVERALTERNEALMSAEKLRNDFVNHVSYELRTPLTNIIGFTQLLADGGAGPLNTKQIEYAGYIRSSSSALLAIINDILDIASIDAGALELRLEDVDVEETMRAGRGRRSGSAEREQHRSAHRRNGGCRRFRGRRPACSAGAVQSLVQRDQFLGSRPDGYAGGDAARPGGRVQGFGPRARYTSRSAGAGFRAV